MGSSALPQRPRWLPEITDALPRSFAMASGNRRRFARASSLASGNRQCFTQAVRDGFRRTPALSHARSQTPADSARPYADPLRNGSEQRQRSRQANGLRSSAVSGLVTTPSRTLEQSADALEDSNRMATQSAGASEDSTRIAAQSAGASADPTRTAASNAGAAGDPSTTMASSASTAGDPSRAMASSAGPAEDPSRAMASSAGPAR